MVPRPPSPVGMQATYRGPPPDRMDQVMGMILTYALARLNINTSSQCWCNRKVIRLGVFLYFSLLLTMALHLPRGRWWPIVFTPSDNSLIAWEDVIPGETCSLLPADPSLDDTSRGLPLIQSHRTEVLTCRSVIHRVRRSHPWLDVLVPCTYLFYTFVSVSLSSCRRGKHQHMLINLLVQQKQPRHKNLF